MIKELQHSRLYKDLREAEADRAFISQHKAVALGIVLFLFLVLPILLLSR